MIIDTHCHLHFPDFDADRDEVIQRARAAGVKYLVNVGTDPENNERAWNLAKDREGVFHTAGLHPHSAHEINEEGLKELERFVAEKKPVAIGEIGLDYFKSEAAPEVQKKVFVHMIHLAMRHNLPLIVHSRNAFDDTLDILKTEGKGKVKGVMHCFSYDDTSLSRLLDIGFFASFTCNLTFKSATALLETALKAPLDRIMLETDSPYLAPQAFRGKRNEPAHLKELVKFLAEKRSTTPDAIERATSDNAVRFFSIPVSHA
jgi:TatD DNase family protein